MKNIPILGKVLAVLSAFGLLAIGSAVFSANKMHQIDSAYGTAIDRDVKAAIYFAQGSRALASAEAAIADLLISNTDSGNDAAVAALKVAQASFVDGLQMAKARVPGQAAYIDDLLQRGLTLIEGTCKGTIALAAVATEPAAILNSQNEFLKACGPGFPPLSEELAVAAKQAMTVVDRVHADAADATENTVRSAYVAICGGLLAVGLGAVVAVRTWISTPLRRLASTMRDLADGKLEAVVGGTGDGDEVGLMARAVQVFKDNGLKLRATEAEARRLAEAAAAERARNDAALAHMQEQQRRVVEGLAAGLEKLAAGDLTYSLAGAFAPEYERLRADFNAAVSQLREAMATIVDGSAAIRSGAGEIAHASDDFSRRTEQQAASLEETAAALDEITATVKRTANGSGHARAIVSAARADAKRSGTVVQDAVVAMGEIEKSSQQINQIIGVIDEIAFQTNLLALNAGIEAARAGDAGRGFAVVASEVRALAQRSADAAKEIKALILASKQHVTQGVTLVGETGQALDRIVSQVGEISATIVEIASSTQEQATGLQQVNAAVNQMDQVTQQNAAMVEQSTAASHALMQETEQLAKLIGRFQVHEPGAERAGRGVVVAPPQTPGHTGRPGRHAMKHAGLAAKNLRIAGG